MARNINEADSAVAPLGSDLIPTLRAGVDNPISQSITDVVRLLFTAALEAKLGAIQAGAQVNPTDAELRAQIDRATGGTVWRSAHTVLRTAVEVRDLLATVLGANWWQNDGGGGSGVTLDQAIDGVGAALAALAEFTYDANANTFTFAIPNGSIQVGKILADTVARRIAWRAQIGAVGLTDGAALPDLAEVNVRDLHLMTQDVARGLSFVDVLDQTTVLNAADAGDIMMVLLARGSKVWVRMGNALKGSAALRALIAAIETSEVPHFTTYPDKYYLFNGEHVFTLNLHGIDKRDPALADVDRLRIFVQGSLVANVPNWTVAEGARAIEIAVGAIAARNIADNNVNPVVIRIELYAGVHTEPENWRKSVDFRMPVVAADQRPARLADLPTIPAAPTVVQAYTAAAIAVDSAAEFTVATARITPRSSATRVRVEGFFDSSVQVGRNSGYDLRMRLRLYRGNTMIDEREIGDNDAPQQDDHFHSHFGFVIDSPASDAEQTYTLRAIRQGQAINWSVTRRRLILTEVL